MSTALVDINTIAPYRFRHREGNTYSIVDAFAYANGYTETHALEDYKVLFLPERLPAHIMIVLEKYRGADIHTGAPRAVPPMNPIHARVLRSFFGPISKEMTSLEVAMAICQDRGLEVMQSMGCRLPKRRGPEPAKEEVKPATEPVKRKSLAERRAERRAAMGVEAPAEPEPGPLDIPAIPAPTGGLTVEMLENARREIMGEPMPPRRAVIDPIAQGIANGITDAHLREATLTNLTTGATININQPDERPRA